MHSPRYENKKEWPNFLKAIQHKNKETKKKMQKMVIQFGDKNTYTEKLLKAISVREKK